MRRDGETTAEQRRDKHDDGIGVPSCGGGEHCCRRRTNQAVQRLPGRGNTGDERRDDERDHPVDDADLGAREAERPALAHQVALQLERDVADLRRENGWLKVRPAALAKRLC